MTNNKNKFDWHNYRFALGLLIAIIVFILSYYQISIITIIHSLYKNKVVRYYLTISYIIIIILSILRCVYIISMIYLIRNNKFNRCLPSLRQEWLGYPIFIPFLLKKSFNRIKTMCEDGSDLNFIINMYYKYMFLYTILLFIVYLASF